METSTCAFMTFTQKLRKVCECLSGYRVQSINVLQGAHLGSESSSRFLLSYGDRGIQADYARLRLGNVVLKKRSKLGKSCRGRRLCDMSFAPATDKVVLLIGRLCLLRPGAKK